MRVRGVRALRAFQVSPGGGEVTGDGDLSAQNAALAAEVARLRAQNAALVAQLAEVPRSAPPCTEMTPAVFLVRRTPCNSRK